MAKIDRHYQEELSRLHEMAAEYAQINPSQAGFLAGAGSDPDVERILEGVAFLTAGLRSELEKDQAQLLQNVLQVAAPDLLRSLPSVTLMQFRGRSALKERMRLGAGTPVAGVLPGNQHRCEFRTSMPLDLVPLDIEDAEFRKSKDHEAGVYCLSIGYSVTFGDISQLAGQAFSLYLNAPQGTASAMMDALLQHCIGVDVVAGGQPPQSAPPPQWDTSLLQWPLMETDQPDLPAQRMMQRYFMAPELAQGVRFTLPEALRSSSASTLRLQVYFDGYAEWPTKVELKKALRLNVVPAVNLFTRDAPPRVRDLRQVYTPLLPRQRDDEVLSVFGIESLTGQYRSESEAHVYQPFWKQGIGDRFQYQEQLISHPVTDELELAVALGSAARDEQEVIKARLHCTNGSEAAGLAPGQISSYVSGSPELVQFENLTTPTPYRKALPSEQQYWQAVKQLSGNLMGHLSTERLVAALREMVLQSSPDRARQQVNLKKVDAIRSVSLTMGDRLVSAMSVRGYEVAISLTGDHFPGKGDLQLFARLLQQFFIGLVPVNYFCLLKVTDLQSGEVVEWAPMLGRKPLL